MATFKDSVDWLSSNPPVVTGIAAVLLAILINTLTTPRQVDPREPPLLKPTIPFIGHIIGLIRHQAEYHRILQRKSGQAIVTLPMLTGKMYAIWDPSLISAGLKNKHLSTKPQIKSAVSPLMKVSKGTVDLMMGDQGDHLQDRIMLHAIPTSFSGEAQQSFIEGALKEVSRQFTSLSSSSQQQDIPNVWVWVRELVAKATTPPLYGKDQDPFTRDPSLIQYFWDYNEYLMGLLIDIFPSILARKGHLGRKKLVEALAPYYKSQAEDSPDASALIRLRAREMRNAGLPVEDIAKIEALLPFAAMTNTVPTLFWFFTHVFTRPEVVKQLRKEVEDSLLSRDGPKAKLVLSTSILEQTTPLLWSCYKETLRLTVHQIATRTVMQDTTITSNTTGRTYFLQEGTVVQMSIGVSHSLPEYWGTTNQEFKADRFVGLTKEEERGLKIAHQPYGGGLHLCPGRHFALAEMMAIMTTLLVGFKVDSLDGREDWKGPDRGVASIVDAATKPKSDGQGFGARIRRRKGWEDVAWEYEF
ncbi:putative cytochrome P450 E-class, group IV [Triangularia verruculosa]|uniref:Cytochrome P450 E-class, group IV n=1 Tax=Triangularia verruculosa TaxID=2587418 RepID=A0AAN7AXX6_9PEZI|nr:putative cytochrome P450 E-class, group IV [Triangularia verruculosa]